VAEQRERLGAGPDEHEARVEAATREARLLAQETIAGMDSVARRLACEREQRLGVEVRARPPAGECPRDVDAADVEARRVVRGEDADRRDGEVAGRARDPD